MVEKQQHGGSEQKSLFWNEEWLSKVSSYENGGAAGSGYYKRMLEP